MENHNSFLSPEVERSIKTRWEEKLNVGTIHYNPDKDSLHKNIGIYTVTFLPGRLEYLKSTPPKAEIIVDAAHTSDDAFCASWPEITTRTKLTELHIGNFTWTVLANNSPIERYHCVLIPNGQARNQTITLSYLEDLVALASSAKGITLGFNSLGGAASQNHFHAHLFFNVWSREVIDAMPIKREHFSLREVPQAVAISDHLVAHNTGHNMTLSHEGIVVTPRKHEHINGLRYGVDAISGRFLTTSTEEYQAMNMDTIKSILGKIAILG